MKRGGRGGGWLKSTTRKPTKTGKEAKKEENGAVEEDEMKVGKKENGVEARENEKQEAMAAATGVEQA